MRKLALIALLAGGCVKTESGDVLTSGIYGSISAETAGDGVTHVHATLFLGNPINLNFVELTGDDELIASHGGQDKVMVETELLNIVSHHASFQTDLEGEQFEVAFLRTVDDGAPLSIATLPAKFEIDPAPTSASRGGPLTLTWSPSATLDLMSWHAEGDCIEQETGDIQGDTGTVVIGGERLRKRQGDGIADTCPVTVKITRARLGQLDPGYGKGGAIEGRQVRTVTFMSTP